MSRIYPVTFPEYLAHDPLRQAERRFYERLRDDLPHDWLVFYSVPWMAPVGANAALREGESDFVLVHPRQGWLVIELKGGRVGFDPDSVSWWQDTPIGRKSIRPFEQAQRNMHRLAEMFGAIPRDGNLMNQLVYGYGVAFPGVMLPSGTPLPPGVRREMICDSGEAGELGVWVNALLTAFDGRERLTAAEGERVTTHIRSRLTPSIELPFSLSSRLQFVEESIQQLTAQQVSVLQAMGVHKRLAVYGCAGSGKTMLATAKARQLAGEGFHTLLTCCSEKLAGHLADTLSDVKGPLVVRSLQVLAREWRTKLSLPAQTGIADTLLAVAEKLSDAPAYDAVIVDEGQDLSEDEWVALRFLGGDSGIFYAFYDNNQKLRLGGDSLPERLELMRWPLTQNVRNSVSIWQQVKRLYDAPQQSFSFGIQGPPTETIPVTTEAQLQDALRRRLHGLINADRIPANQIVVLTPRDLADSALPEIFATLTAPQNHVRFASVADFKGLEASVVILVELDALLEESPKRLELAYVGMSRARAQLILIGDNKTFSALESGFA